MDVQVVRRRLEAERERLREVRHGLSDGAGAAELTSLDQHQADLATDVVEREIELSLVARVDAELVEVADALARLERGAYGACETCGEVISDDRLGAVPATRFCVDHESMFESDQVTAFLPAGKYPDGAAFADDVAAREAVQHLDLLPDDDELEGQLELGPEESAMHLTGSAAPTQRAAATERLLDAEAREAEERDGERMDQARQAAEHRAEAEAVELQEEELDAR